MKSKFLFCLTCAAAFMLMAGFCYADDESGGDATRDYIRIEELDLFDWAGNQFSIISHAIVDTRMISGSRLLVGHSDSLSSIGTGNEDEFGFRHRLTVYIETNIRSIDQDGDIDINYDLLDYPEDPSASARQVSNSIITETSLSGGGWSYEFPIYLSNDQGTTFDFEDVDTVIPGDPYLEMGGADSSGFDLFIQVENLENSHDIFNVGPNVSAGDGLDTRNGIKILYDSWEPKKIANSDSVGAIQTYDEATNRWEPVTCDDTLSFYVTVQDSAPDTTYTNAGIDASYARFFVGGTSYPFSDSTRTGTRVVFCFHALPTYFTDGVPTVVTFAVSDSAGNRINFDGSGRPSDGGSAATARLNWGNNSDQVTVNKDMPRISGWGLLFPFEDRVADTSGVFAWYDTTGSTTPTAFSPTYPNGAIGHPSRALEYEHFNPFNPATDVSQDLNTDTLFTDISTGSADSFYVVIEARSGWFLRNNAANDTVLVGYDLLRLDGGYFEVLSRCNVQTDLASLGELVVVARDSGRIVAAYVPSGNETSTFGQAELHYPGSNNFIVGGCEITDDLRSTFFFDYEGGTISPHNKNNEGGEGGWEYGFSASPLGDSLCTDPTPNNSEALNSPHLSIPTEWEFTWQLVAESQQTVCVGNQTEVLLGGFNLPDSSGYTTAMNASGYDVASQDTLLRMIYAVSGHGLNDSTPDLEMALRPTSAPHLIKVVNTALAAPGNPHWGWDTTTDFDVWQVAYARDLFGNTIDQGFEEQHTLPGTGITGELFYLNFASIGIESVTFRSTNPNDATDSTLDPGAFTLMPGDTVWVGILANIAMEIELPRPIDGTDPERLLPTTLATPDTANSFVFMDTDQSASAGYASDNFKYWDFFGFGDPDSEVVSMVGARRYYTWYHYVADGTEDPGHYAIGVWSVPQNGCNAGFYVDSQVDAGWTDPCEMPDYVEAGNNVFGTSDDEQYRLDTIYWLDPDVGGPSNFVENFYFVPRPPQLDAWELFDPTACSNFNTDGYSSGDNFGIDPLNEELIGGRFSIICDPSTSQISGPIDQFAIMVGDIGTLGFDADDFQVWSYIESDSSFVLSTNPPTPIEILFDINDLLIGGHPGPYTEAPDGWYNNIRIAVRSSSRPEIFDVWTPFGSFDQNGNSGSDINSDGTSQMNWFLDEVPPVITLDTPDTDFAFPDPNGGDFYYTNLDDGVWQLPFTAYDPNPGASSGLATTEMEALSADGNTTTVPPTGDQFVYTGALTDGDGRYVFTATTEDNACNLSDQDTLVMILDSEPPELADAVETFDTDLNMTDVTTNPEFWVAIDFTPEIPNPYVPSLFGMPNNDPNGFGGGKIHIFWREGPVGVQPVGDFSLYQTIDLSTATDGVLFTGDSDVEFLMDVTPTTRDGSGRYEFTVVFEDQTGNLSEFLIQGVPPSDPDPDMTSYIDISIIGPESSISSVTGDDAICVDSANQVVLSGTSTNPDAMIVDPGVRLFYRVGDSLGDENGDYASVRETIPNYDGVFTPDDFDEESVDFTFTLTRAELEQLAGDNDPHVVYFKTNAYGTGDAVEHTVTSNTISVSTSDAMVLSGSDPATAFTTVEMVQPSPSATNASSITLAYNVAVADVYDVDSVELWVDSPVSTTYQLADTETFTSGSGSNSFDYTFVLINDGEYSFQIMAYTNCGLASEMSDEITVCLDRGVPAPTLTLTDYSPNGILNIEYPNVLITMTENPDDPDPACGSTVPTIYVKGPSETVYTSYSGSTLDMEATESGIYSFYGKVVDAAGNVDSTEVSSIEADMDAPDVSWLDLIDGYNENDCYPPESGFTNINMVEASVTTQSDDIVTLNFSGDLAVSSDFNYVQGTEYSLILDTDLVVDGSKVVVVTATDDAGNLSIAMRDTIMLDMTAPDYRFDELDSPYTSDDAVTLDISDYTDDGNGEENPLEMEIWYQQPGTSWSTIADNIVAPATTYEFLPVNGQGTYYLAIRGVDRAGNCGPAPTDPEATITFDWTNPSSEIVTDVEDCQTGDISVTVTYEDVSTDIYGSALDGAGVTRINLYESVNGEAPVVVDSVIMNPPSADGTVIMSYTPTQQGTTALYAQATDAADNVEATYHIVNFLRDTVDPVVSQEVEITSSQTDLRIIAGASVSDSYGLDYANWTVNGETVDTEELSGLSADVSLDYSGITEGGDYAITLEIFDGCGNSATSQASITIDNQSPESEITTQVTDCPSGQLSLTVSYSDDVVGVTDIGLWQRVNGGTALQVDSRDFSANVGPSTVSFTYTPSVQGEIELYTIATDSYDNAEQEPTTADVVFNYDGTNPAVSIGVTITSETDESQIQASAVVSDAQNLDRAEWSVNGLLTETQSLTGQTSASLTFSHDVTQDGLYTVTMTVYDVCENFTDATPASIQIELAGPASSIETDVSDCATAPISLEVDYSDGTVGITALRLWEVIDGDEENVGIQIPSNSPDMEGTVTFSYTPSEDGNIGLYTTAINASGEEEDEKNPTVTFLYDTTGPSVFSSVTILSTDQDTTLRAQSVVQDTYGLGYAEWYVNSDLVETQQLDGETVSTTLSLTYELNGGGVYNVDMKVFDTCGNFTDATQATISIDILAPTSEILTTIGSCPTAPMTLTVQFQDDVSGVASVYLYESIDGGEAYTVLINTLDPPNQGPSTTSFSYTPTHSGVVSLYTVAEDAVGNTQIALQDFPTFIYGDEGAVVDWTGYADSVNTDVEPNEALAPRIDVSYESDVALQSVTLYYRFRESQDAAYGEWTSYGETSNPMNSYVTFDTDNAAAQGDGYYQFQFTGTDACGNTSQLGSGVISGTVAFDFSVVDFVCNFTVYTASQSSIGLEIGTAADATQGFDPDYDQIAPTSNQFYAYFTGSGYDLAHDYRATNQDVTVWELYLDAPSYQRPIYFNWNFEGLDLDEGGFWLQDITASVVDINMREVGSYTVPDGITRLRIIHTNTHFPYFQTGNPYSLVFTAIDVDGQLIEAGDEIGVFDGDLGVGSDMFDGQFNYPMSVWQADLEHDMPGFTNGNTMRFKLWDQSEQSLAVCQPTYIQGDGTFGHGIGSTLSLSCTHNCDLCIDIKTNQFDLVSFNLMPNEPNVSDIFGQLPGLEIVQTSDGHVYIPSQGINTIGDVELGKGYRVYITSSDNQDQQLCEIGQCIENQPDLTVNPGLWNWISYLCDSPHPIETSLGDISSSVEIVTNSDGDAWIPSLGVNTIQNMEPGDGYRILLKPSVTNPAVFSYNCYGAPTARSDGEDSRRLESDEMETPISRQPHFRTIETGQSYSVVIQELDLRGDSEESVLEIGIYDQDTCVGSAEVTGEYPLLIPAWQAIPEFDQPGYLSGNPMSFRIWEDGQDRIVKPIYVQGNGSFGYGGYAVVILTDHHIEQYDAEVSSIFGNNPSKTELLQNYPNPFNPSTQISFTLAYEGDVELSVYDISGRLVKRLINESMSAGHYQAVWNGDQSDGKSAPSGVYLCRLRVDSMGEREPYQEHKRMALLK
ncbi:MAG: hypothetical protein B6244_08510 [Candidatus Cloacimonetes bacterium 4572_55]|nr:MAG: hypothetical protein B6244_08510 [Candidatus Cloacimonetes bacterium 4572_55]